MARDTRIDATDINSIKARVKAEMLRRKRNGSVAGYGGSAYDYTVTPAADVKVALEHLDKNLEPLRAVNPAGLPEPGEKYALDADYQAVNAKLTLFETKSIKGGTSDCASSCTGMCVNACSGDCWNSCSGCGGNCSYNCTGCTGSCTGDCQGTCDDTCTGDCTGSCDDTCTGSCTGTCTGECSDDCVGYCNTGCSGGCIGGCTGTSGSQDSHGHCSGCTCSCSHACSDCAGGCYSCLGGCAGCTDNIKGGNIAVG